MEKLTVVDADFVLNSLVFPPLCREKTKVHGQTGFSLREIVSDQSNPAVALPQEELCLLPAGPRLSRGLHSQSYLMGNMKKFLLWLLL